MRNIRYAIDWILGGYYNDLQDGIDEYFPESPEALKNEVYDAAMCNLYGPGHEGCGKAPKEMRFAGEPFCRAYIDWKISSDGDYQEIADYLHWN